MMYACSIYSNADLNDKKRRYTHKTLDALRSIQARAARSICGAYRVILKVALDVDKFLLPIEQQTWKHNADVITQLSSLRAIAKTASNDIRLLPRSTVPLAPRGEVQVDARSEIVAEVVNLSRRRFSQAIVPVI